MKRLYIILLIIIGVALAWAVPPVDKLPSLLTTPAEARNISVIVGGSPPSAGGPSALYTSATAIWDFENNANDTKGTHNLTANGSITYSTTGEAQGTYWAGECDGSTDYFSLAGAQATFGFTGDYSVSAWVNYTYVQEGAYTGIVSYGDGSNGWAVTTDGSRHVRVTHQDFGTPRHADFTGATLNNSTRYHVVVAYSDSGNTVTAWVSTTSFGNIINGTSVTQNYNPTTSGTLPLNVARNIGPDDVLYGYIDEVVVFGGKVLNSTEAEAIFNARDGGTSWR